MVLFFLTLLPTCAKQPAQPLAVVVTTQAIKGRDAARSGQVKGDN